MKERFRITGIWFLNGLIQGLGDPGKPIQFDVLTVSSPEPIGTSPENIAS